MATRLVIAEMQSLVLCYQETKICSSAAICQVALRIVALIFKTLLLFLATNGTFITYKKKKLKRLTVFADNVSCVSALFQDKIMISPSNIRFLLCVGWCFVQGHIQVTTSPNHLLRCPCQIGPVSFAC